ncbi:restriction endonuclease subunit S [Tessaracoccus lacteus]|uniref:Restriction endonuclease subunit S n=1 Tax=Tessaracoccus lacteus TaxID=3041766 RepID=A0ABY8PX43_9ACTN|nr:restriction endonuclease subunit S [Tessaracoccus sp. T21]WGT46732.1 restriction endonuclease subunit S [Tessaracoccus sp. T21]
MTAARMKTIGGGGPIRVFAGGNTVADVAEGAVPAKDVVRVPSIIVKSRGHIGFAYYEHPFTHKAELWSYSINAADVDQKFVYYFLLTQTEYLQRVARATSVKLPQLSVRDTDDLRIPVPPLEVQREIVRVLDQFSQLEAELEAELEARRHQYAHYRQVMLDSVDAPRVRLASLGAWVGGMTPSKQNAVYWERGTIPWLASMDVSDESTNEIRGRVTSKALDETSLRIVSGPSIAVVMRSNILRRTLPIGYVTTDTTVNQDIRALAVGEGVDARYVFQVLRADSERIREQCVRTDGSMAAVDSKSFFAWEVPLPALEKQRQVARALDAFDVLVNDLSVGLPAELALRRKQYGYYRDKLLTFKETAA